MSKNNVTCYGRHYNFKKGFEICKNRSNCQFYDEDAINMVANEGFDSVRHNSIKEFRKCKKSTEQLTAP